MGWPKAIQNPKSGAVAIFLNLNKSLPQTKKAIYIIAGVVDINVFDFRNFHFQRLLVPAFKLLY